jgi:hypothetical protein
MLAFLIKNKLISDIIMAVTFLLLSVNKFFLEEYKDKRTFHLIGGVVFGLLAIIKIVEIAENIKKKKVEK